MTRIFLSRLAPQITTTLANSIEETASNFGMAMGSHPVYEVFSVQNYGLIYRPHPNLIGFDQNY